MSPGDCGQGLLLIGLIAVGAYVVFVLLDWITRRMKR
jgi:hypothetical protein